MVPGLISARELMPLPRPGVSRDVHVTRVRTEET